MMISVRRLWFDHRLFVETDTRIYRLVINKYIDIVHGLKPSLLSVTILENSRLITND